MPDAEAGDHLEDTAAGGGARRGYRGGAGAGRHPVPRVGGFSLAAAGFFVPLVAGVLLEACPPSGVLSPPCSAASS